MLTKCRVQNTHVSPRVHWVFGSIRTPGQGFCFVSDLGLKTLPWFSVSSIGLGSQVTICAINWTVRKSNPVSYGLQPH